jgi:hypothetical protein
MLHTTTTRQALARMFDDASQFPPGNMPLGPAWSAHQRWRAGEYADLVGRFLVPAGRAPELARAIEDSDAIEIGIVAPGERPDDVGSLLDGPAEVTSIELRGSRVAEDIGAWRARAPRAWIFLEGAPLRQVASLRDADRQVGAKLRCGGLEAGAFPSCEAVASFIAECVRLDVPFKATAGLHGPMRRRDSEIGAFHHGFMNLWVATALAAHGSASAELEHALAAEHLDALPTVDHDDLAGARAWFTGLGTCSIAEPLEGLQALGLLDG